MHRTYSSISTAHWFTIIITIDSLVLSQRCPYPFYFFSGSSSLSSVNYVINNKMESTNITVTPSPSSETLSADETQLMTLHCHSEQWRQLINYMAGPNWTQVPSDLKHILIGLVSWDGCPCGTSAEIPTPESAHSTPSVSSELEMRLSRMESAINSIKAAFETGPTPQPTIVRPVRKRIVLVTPYALTRTRATELVRLAVPNCKASIIGLRGNGPFYTIIEGNEKTLEAIGQTCPENQFSLGGNIFSWIINPTMSPCTRCGRGSLCQLEGVEALCSGCLSPSTTQATSPQNVAPEPDPTPSTPAPTSEVTTVAPVAPVAPVQTPTQQQRRRRTPAPAPIQTSEQNSRRRRNVNSGRPVTTPRQPQAEPRQRRRQPQQPRRGPSPPQHQQAKKKNPRQQQHNRGNNGAPPARFIPPRMQRRDSWSFPGSSDPPREYWPSYSRALQRPPPPRDYEWPELSSSRYDAPQPWYRDYY